MLELRGVAKKEKGELYLDDISLSLSRGGIHVLLGPTRSGKTTLMRIMAGLDQPAKGAVLMDGADVTALPVRKRNIAMVYQQFVNYPTLTVYENIASPLRVRGVERKEVDRRVNEIADLTKLRELLARKPNELSGGQQQRVALARAIVKEAGLTLLDEPLANLDYKLREELRGELPKLFQRSKGIVIYATSEPEEAIALGDSISCLYEGRLAGFGAPRDLYNRPQQLTVAKIMTKPPLNILRITKKGAYMEIGDKTKLEIANHMAPLPDGEYDIGLRAHHIRAASPQDRGIHTKVSIAEVVGSETIVHFDIENTQSIALFDGVHSMKAGDDLSVTVNTSRIFAFSLSGDLVAAPEP